jgi:Pentapeptide repeats (8 copies)
VCSPFVSSDPQTVWLSPYLSPPCQFSASVRVPILLAKIPLIGVNLTDARLPGANLSRANLYGAKLYRANLTGADLTQATLATAFLAGQT